ncbi:MAG: hypothetical protein OEZ43_12395 [Gammaproteobacteria bacterium]|nr:hypothetical protein [Gammaproteobacteria bacterium]
MENKKTSPLIIASLLLLVSNVYAEDNSFGSAKHAFGVSAGTASGGGLTFRQYLSNGFLQGRFFSVANGYDKLTNLLLGASYGHVLSEISMVKALPPTALVLTIGADGHYTQDDIVGSGFNKFASGVGVALEIGNTFSPGLMFSIGMNYALVMDKDIGSWNWNLGPQLDVSMFYNW